MFVIAELKSTVKVHPSQFSKNLAEVSKFELNKKLANKVLHNVGLCISFREVVAFGDSCILPNDGELKINFINEKVLIIYYRIIAYRCHLQIHCV